VLGWGLSRTGAPVGKSAGPPCLVGQQVLDLAIDAAQIILRPAPNDLEQAGVKPEQEALAVRHAQV
jgi:hypothetical protein